MREIKFRCLLFNRNTGGKVWRYYSVGKKPLLGSWEDWATPDLQYTEQKDNNDVGVWEGDVAEIQQPTSVTRGQIVFREGAFAFLSNPWPNGERDIVYLHSIKFQETWKLKVIGNIYENPELLK